MRGRSIPLSVPRRIVADFMRLAKTIPSVPVERTIDVSALVAARRACSPRPPWIGMLTKAYGLAAQEFPDLRRVFLKWPWPHLYEYPASVAMITVDRDYEGEPCVLMRMIKDPAARSVTEIADIIHHAATVPVEEIKEFRRALNFAKLPGILRRPLWWLAFNIGRQRANFFGTVVVSTVSHLGTDAIHPLSLTPNFLTYGMIESDGRVPLRIIFDHRIFDGVVVARVLARMEALLNGPVLEELRAAATKAAVPGA
jgi:pyruvate/2-oxoglutarate dehydrogenase complex dihydrolipoamide acyltransferase (E2) component